MGREYYCTLTLTAEEVERLEAFEGRTDWEIQTKRELSKPERVRRALAKVLIEKGDRTTR